MGCAELLAGGVCYPRLVFHFGRPLGAGNMIGRIRSAGEAAERRRQDDGLKRWKETRWEKDENRPDDGIIRAKETRQERFDRTAKQYNRDADVNMKRLAWPPVDADKRPGRAADDGIRRSPETRAEHWQKAGGGGFPFRKPKTGEGRSGEMSPPRSEHILALRERVKDVELEIRPAEWMAGYYAENPNICWYFDPPYQVAAEKGLYTHNALPIDQWVPLLQGVRGLAAISGYNDEWDGLGWLRHEHRTHGSVGAQNDQERPVRVEVLWTNYDPARYETTPGLFG